MSLSKDQLIQFIEKPGLLKEQTIAELKEVVDEFPYFQTAQLLYTYNLHAQANFRYAGYLKTCSIYATDRNVLYRLLQPKTESNVVRIQHFSSEASSSEAPVLFELSDENQITETDFSLLTSASSTEAEIIDFDLLSFEQQDLSGWQDETESIFVQDENPVQDKLIDIKAEEKVDLIDQFIKVNPTIQPRTDYSTPQNDSFELKEEESNENDEFITETLSRIYLKQGHYQKAIDSFKRLSLKFPEKSVYFAQQIEEIKKSLN